MGEEDMKQELLCHQILKRGLRTSEAAPCDTQNTAAQPCLHDGHGLGRDTGVGVHLLEHLVDVDLVGLSLQG